MNNTNPDKSGESLGLWLLKIITGALVIVLLFVHLVVNHFFAPEGLLTYSEVVAYLSNPWIALMEMTFLIVVVSHGLLGARSLLLDFKPSRSVLQAINISFLALGIVSIVYGIWLIRVIVT